MAIRKLYDAVERVNYRPSVAKTGGTIIPMADGRIGFLPFGLSASELGSIEFHGIIDVPKAANIIFLKGQAVWYSLSAATASYTGDILIGVASEAAVGTAETVPVEMNIRPMGIRSMDRGDWIRSTTANGSLVNHAAKVHAAFTTANEAQRAVYYNARSITIADLPVIEFWVKIKTATDNAAANWNVGLSTEDHATAFATGAKYASLNFKGNDLSLWIQSKDGTNTNAATDTTVDAVVGTELFVQIDLSGTTPKIYVNGLDKTPAGLLAFAPGATALYPIIDAGKTADDGPGEIHVRDLIVRSMREAA